MKSLRGRVVVLTDGSSALSRFLALELARVGACIALWTQDDNGDPTKARQIVDEVMRAYPRTNVHVFDVDVSNQQSIQQGAKSVQRELGRIDVLMNNTDFLHGATLLTSSGESVERGFALNAMATIWATRTVLPQMLSENSGTIVNFGTSADALGAPKLVDYCTSKYAVMGFHEALRQELHYEKKTGIAMVLVCPTLLVQDGGTSQDESAPKTKLISSVWIRPQQAAKEIVRAVRRNKTKLVLPPDFGILSGSLAVLPDNFAAWVRDQLGLSKVMDQFVAPTAGRYAYASV
ncbi:Retinol dehydrogenase, partial [Globisporangium splendens]